MNTNLPQPKSTMQIRKSPSGDASVEIVAVMRNVSMTFDEYLTRSLANVNLQIRRGEIFGVMGPAGAGKSTALRILAGRLRPTEGTVKVFGRSPRSAGAKARIGYLPENAAQERPKGLAGIVDLLKTFLLGSTENAKKKRADQPMDKEQRRQHFARAILGNRELIVLDEPFSGLDSRDCRELQELVVSLTERGRTVVLSVSSVMEAKDICSRMAILRDGKVQAVGTLDELLSKPDAVHFFGSLLPPPTTSRILKVIREDLNLDAPDHQSPGGKTKSASPSESAPVARDVNETLAPLLHATKPAVSLESAQSVADSVDHERLAELTKPGKSGDPR